MTLNSRQSGVQNSVPKKSYSKVIMSTKSFMFFSIIADFHLMYWLVHGYHELSREAAKLNKDNAPE